MLQNEADLPLTQCVLSRREKEGERMVVGEENHKGALMHMFDKDK